jgi:hypothetical protein
VSKHAGSSSYAHWKGGIQHALREALSRFVPHAYQLARHVACRAPSANQTQSDAIKRTSELDTLPVERHLLRLLGRLELSLARLIQMGERCAEIVDLLLELHLVLTKRDELLATCHGHQRPLEVIRGHQRSSEVIRSQLMAIRGHQSSSPVLATCRASVSIAACNQIAIRGNKMQSEAICSNHLPVRLPCLQRRLQTPCAQPMH